jgi:hypothetical protein
MLGLATDEHQARAISECDAHSSMECNLPQSMQRVPEKRFEQLGQAARVWKVSKGWLHPLQTQYAPIAGAVLQVGHAKPSRRGSLASFNNARACCSPLQQFIRI